jgi:hypothetical protein
MVDETNAPSLGLSIEERALIKRAAAKFPTGWCVSLETTDSEETYARVVPPWDKNASAFLIDREGHGLVLTDNLSDPTGPVMQGACDVRDVMDCLAGVAWVLAVFKAAVRNSGTETLNPIAYSFSLLTAPTTKISLSRSRP